MKQSGTALSGLRIIEGSAFVAAPLGGLTLSQLGAEVIRFDQIDGGLDYHRWPVNKENKSLFWAGLNRGKKSIQVDLKKEEGRKIVAELISAPGKDAGIFLTNLPTRDWLSYEELSKRRPDLIMISMVGNFDGSSEVDYTVHPAFGYPSITGPRDSKEPINSIVPTWDLLLGNLAAISLLAAERNRTRTGAGELISIALSDVALSVTGALGRLSQAHLDEEEINRDGNFLYGAFGNNFITKDGHQIMLVGLTQRQWSAIVKACNLEASVEKLEKRTGADFTLEGDRYRFRDELFESIKSFVEPRSLAELTPLFYENKVSWSKFQTFKELLAEDFRASTKNPIFSMVNEPGYGALPNISSPIRFSNLANLGSVTAPTLGEHTSQVLQDILKYSAEDIQDLIRDKIIR
jgi:2-methylfumaryl-CoA isomerase